MHILKVIVMMKKIHEPGDGADDHAGLYMSRCQYTTIYTVLSVLDCEFLQIMQNLESIVALSCSFYIYSCCFCGHTEQQHCFAQFDGL